MHFKGMANQNIYFQTHRLGIWPVFSAELHNDAPWQTTECCNMFYRFHYTMFLLKQESEAEACKDLALLKYYSHFLSHLH